MLACAVQGCINDKTVRLNTNFVGCQLDVVWPLSLVAVTLIAQNASNAHDHHTNLSLGRRLLYLELHQ